MKKILFLLVLAPAFLFSQDFTIDKGAGILYFTGVPGTTPDITCCAEIAYDVTTREIYVWDRTNTQWVKNGVASSGTGAPSGDPGTGSKLYVDGDTGDLYQWTGSQWEQIQTRPNKVHVIGAAADTSTLSNPIEGDVAMIGDSILYLRDSLQWRRFNGGSGGGGSTTFDSDRNILRVPTVGVNIGGSTMADWMEYWYFTPPTISLTNPSPNLFEVGTSNSVTLAGSTTNDGGATLSNGELRQTAPGSSQVISFGANTSYTTDITFTPQQGGTGDYNELSYSFRASQDYSGTESGTDNSPTRTITAVYPVFAFMSATDYSDTGTYPGLALGTAVYTDATGSEKVVETEGNKSVAMTGTSQYVYYIVPKTWTDFDLSQILDPNSFNVTGDFTAYDVTLSSTGLANDYTNEQYKMYKSNGTQTWTGQSFQFNR